MYSRRPARGLPTFGSMGSGSPPPRDLIVILAIVFVTFALRFFALTAPVVALAQLSLDVVRRGFLWQLATYPFVGSGAPGLWFVISLLLIFWFGRDTYYQCGRRGFWTLIGWGAIGGGVVAIVAQLVLGLLPGFTGPLPFVLMQGQSTLLTLFIAAFATLNREATIYLFFVLPIKAKWFIPLEILFAFLGFLSSRDLAGFLGLVAVVGITYSGLTPGGVRRLTRELRLRIEQAWIKLKLRRMQGRRAGRSTGDGNVKRGPWVN